MGSGSVVRVHFNVNNYYHHRLGLQQLSRYHPHTSNARRPYGTRPTPYTLCDTFFTQMRPTSTLQRSPFAAGSLPITNNCYPPVQLMLPPTRSSSVPPLSSFFLLRSRSHYSYPTSTSFFRHLRRATSAAIYGSRVRAAPWPGLQLQEAPRLLGPWASTYPAPSTPQPSPHSALG